MDCYSPRRNMNAGRMRNYPAASLIQSVPDLPPEQAVPDGQLPVSAASCGCNPCGSPCAAAAPKSASCGCQTTCHVHTHCERPTPQISPIPTQCQAPPPAPMPQSNMGCSPTPSPMPCNRMAPVMPNPCRSCVSTAASHLEQHYALAMAYVPWQQWQQLYTPEQGFARGTMFPDLYLPFQPRRCRV